MKRSLWWTASICVFGALLLAWGLAWFTAQFAEENAKDTGRLAYRPVEAMPPRVDLGAVQRAWPSGLGDREDARRLRSYLQDIEGQAPALSVAGPRAEATPPPDLGTLLASADANAGRARAQVCMSCHDFTAGGPNRIGPNLWQVVGRGIASHPGFAYSPALAERRGAWTYDLLFDFLAHPARTVPGTKMSFAGLSRPEDRAAVIRFLATLGGNSPPLPSPQPGGTTAKAR